jgi:transcriptional regulator with XRE-family HTH domain
MASYDKHEQELLNQLGKTIRKYREEKGLSQEKLGFKSELDRTYIGSVERGERNIAAINLIKIANALEIHVSNFFEWLPQK